MIQMTSRVAPILANTIARGQGRGFVNLLRRSTRYHAKPTLEAAKALVPVKSGRLRASLAITGLTTPSQGTVSAVVMPRSDFSFRDQAGDKRLVVGARTKAQRIAQARLRGTQIDENTPFLYAYGIETGKRQDGSLARRKGAVKFLEKGTEAGAQPFITGVSTDAWNYVTTGAGTV